MLTELTNIRMLLEKPPVPPPPVGFKNEFLDFLSKYKVMGLAVAFILAVYLGALVKALVDDLVMPIVQYILPGLNNVSDWKAGHFLIGDFVAAFITFIIVALVIFVIVKLTKRMKIE
jgi:large conductance mechanosensitive channel